MEDSDTCEQIEAVRHALVLKSEMCVLGARSSP